MSLPTQDDYAKARALLKECSYFVPIDILDKTIDALAALYHELAVYMAQTAENYDKYEAMGE